MKRRAYKAPAKTARARQRRYAFASILYQKANTVRDYGSVEPEFDACRPSNVARQFLRGEGVRV